MNGLIENAIIAVDNNGPATPEEQPNKRRRKKSIVWQYFTVEPISPGESRACCKQCKRSFAYIKDEKQAGTSHLNRHIKLGICPVNRLTQEKIQHIPSQNGAVTAPPRKRCRAPPGPVTIAVDRDRCIHEMARMIILHDYPAHMVEQPGFINFIQTLQPHFSTVSFESIHSEIVSIYLREKQLLRYHVDGIPGRVSLTMDLWTSDQTLGYVILTGHFIDADWTLQRRVLNFVLVPFPDSEVAFNHAIVSCLCDWGLESKLFALTLDQSFASGTAVENIRGLLSIKNQHMRKGRFLMTDCYARVLSRLVREALGANREAVSRVRDSVKYVKASEFREAKFNELKQQLRVPCTKGLVIDNLKRWDSTYHMLSTALALKEVFLHFDTRDPDYKISPSMEDWRLIEDLCSYLKLFFDAADVLTFEPYPSSNVFFHEAWKIQLKLVNGALSEDPCVSNFARLLYENFDKYWRNCCVILAMAVSMDPRYKLKVVEFSFAKVFGEEAEAWIRTIDDAIHELYFEYIAQTLPLPDIHCDQSYDGVGFVKTDSHQEDEALPPDGLSDFDIYISEISSTQQTKSEIDQYLDELLLPRGSGDFDVVEWWKLNRIKYPTLSKMAADILSIPVATVSRDSVFDTVSKKVDSDRCSLKPVTLEAIVCANNWLKCAVQQSTSATFDFSAAIVKSEIS